MKKVLFLVLAFATAAFASEEAGQSMIQAYSVLAAGHESSVVQTL